MHDGFGEGSRRRLEQLGGLGFVGAREAIGLAKLGLQALVRRQDAFERPRVAPLGFARVVLDARRMQRGEAQQADAEERAAPRVHDWPTAWTG
ncbi:MAG: hypothetical protein IPG50_00590 [Myxococcales bacterium]|nr:hypothetical protein [Myxococcales bacterium]